MSLHSHIGLWANTLALKPITDSDGFALLEINAAEVLDKGGDEVLARLFTVTDDINAGVLLFLQ